MKADIMLFGAGDVGARALAYFGAERIHCFIDNDSSRTGTLFFGKPVISFQEMLRVSAGYRIVISVTFLYSDEIERQLIQAGITDFLCFQRVLETMPIKERPELTRFHNRFQGERIFLIGTGPSLRIADLDKLHEKGLITFASNKIFKAFPKTKWRPTMYCATDYKVIGYYRDEIEAMQGCDMFLSDTADIDIYSGLPIPKISNRNVCRFHLSYRPFDSAGRPPFSDNPAKEVFEGFTVSYAMLQWAAYMGFAKIILLGVDCDYGAGKGQGMPARHFIESYHRQDEVAGRPRIEEMLSAYESAERYSRLHGFRIYNATRGGKIQVFERVDFEEVL